MKKKILSFFTLICLILVTFKMSFNDNIKTSEGASSSNILNEWTSINLASMSAQSTSTSTNYDLMIMATPKNQPIVGYDGSNYTNKLTAITDDTFYITMFLRCNGNKQLKAFGLRYSFDSTQVDNITTLVAKEGYSIESVTDSYVGGYYQMASSYTAAGNSMFANMGLSGLGENYGHTGTTYLDGEAKTVIYDSGLGGNSNAGFNSNTNTFYVEGSSATTVSMSYGVYVVGKFEVKLKSGITNFTFNCEEIVLGEDGTNAKSYSTSYSGSDKTLYNASIGAGAKSDKVDTSIKVIDGSGSSSSVTNITKTYSSSTPSNDFVFEIDNGSSGYYLEAIVDNGTGTVTSTSSNATYQNVNSGTYKYNITDNINQNAYTTITISVQAQDADPAHVATYTIRIIRKANLSSLTLTKPSSSNLADPILSTSSSDTNYSTNEVSKQTGSADYINLKDSTSQTYYIWIPSSLTSFDVKYTFAGQGGIINGTSVASGSSTTINSSTTSFTIKVAADNTNVSSASVITEYKFEIKKITEYISMDKPSVTAAGDSSTTGTSKTDGTTSVTGLTTNNGTSLTSGGKMYNFEIPYENSSNNKVTGVDVITKPSDTSKSKIWYSTDNGSTWLNPGTDYKVNLTLTEAGDGTASGTILYYVEDINTGAISKVYGCTVTRALGDSDNTVQKVELYKVVSNTETLLSGCSWTNSDGPNFDAGTHQYVDVSKIKIKVTANSGNVKYITIESQQTNSSTASYTESYTTTGTYTYSIKITPQTGSDGEYTLKIKIEDNRTNDVSMEHFYVEDDNNTYLTPENGSDKDTVQNGGPIKAETSDIVLNYKVAYGSGNLTIIAVAKDGSVYKNSNDEGAIKIVQVSNITPGSSATYTFVVKTQMGNYSKVYKVVVTRENANSKVGMKDLYVTSGGSTFTFTEISSSNTFTDETSNLHTSSTTLYFFTNLGSGKTQYSVVANVVSKDSAGNDLNITASPPSSFPSLSSNGVTMTYKLTSEDGKVIVDYVLFIYASNDNSNFSSTGEYIRVLNSEKSQVVNGTVTGNHTLLKDVLDSSTYDKQFPISTSDYSWNATISTTDKKVFIDYSLTNNAQMYRLLNGNYTLFKGSAQDITCNSPASGATQNATTIVKLYVFSELQLARINLEKSACGTNYTTFVNNSSTAEFVFTFNVQPSCDIATLHSFESNYGNVKNFVADSSNCTAITIDDIGTNTALVFTFTKTCTSHDHDIVYSEESTYGAPSLNNGKYTVNYNCSWSASQESCTIKIKKEDGNWHTYKITMNSGQAQLDTDKTIGLTTIYSYLNSNAASSTQVYNKVPTDKTQPGETASLTIGDTYVRVIPKLPTGSKATLSLGYNTDGTSTFTNVTLNAGGDGYITVTPSTTQVTYLYLQIGVTAEDTTITVPTDYYYIKLTIPQVSDDNGATQFTVNSASKTPDTNDSVYFDIPNTITGNCPFSFTLNDSNATAVVDTQTTGNSTLSYSSINSTSGTLSGLVKGLNSIIVKVTSSSGQTKNYYVYIWVNEDVYLEGLTVKSSDDQTTHTLSPTFNSNVSPYTTTVPYADTKENLYYTITNLDLSLLDITYKIGNSNTSYYFGTNYGAGIDLASSGSTTVTITVKNKYPNSFNSNVTYHGIQGSEKTYSVEIKKEAANSNKDLINIEIQGNLETSAHIYTQSDLSTTNPKTIVFDRNTQTIDLNNVKHTGKSIDITIDNNATKTAHVRQNDTDPYGWKLQNLQPNKKYTLTVTVKDEGGNSNPYIFYLVIADQNHDITDLKFVDVLGNPINDDNGDQINFQTTERNYRLDSSNNNAIVPYEFAAQYTIIRVTKSMYSYVYVDDSIKMDSYDKTTYDITVNLSNVTAGSNIPVKIYVISELESIYPQNPQSKSDEYVVYVGKVQLDSNSSLHELKFTIVGLNNTDLTSNATIDDSAVTYDFSGHYTINISNVGDAISLNISATPFKSTTFVKTNATTQSVGQTLTESISLSSALNNGYILQYVITSEAQDGSKSTYTINVTRGPLDPSDDNTITGLQFYDSNSKFYVGESSVHPSVAVYDSIDHVYPTPYSGYNIIIPYGTSSFTINASVYAGSYASVVFEKDGVLLTNTSQYSYQETITSTMWNNTYTYIVYAKSQSGTPGDKYAFIVKFEKPNDNNLLDILTVDNGVNYIDITPKYTSPDGLTVEWDLPAVDFNKTYVNVYAYIADPTATILASSDVGNCPLQEGANTLVVQVLAQNGDIKTYKLNITRNSKNPTLYDLSVTGQPLLDSNQQQTTFDPNVFDYTVIIPYEQEYAEIVAQVTDPINQTVSIAGNIGLVSNVYVDPGQSKTVTVTITDQTSSLSQSYNVNVIRLNEDTVNADLDKVIIDKLDGGNNSIGGLDDKNNTIDSFVNDWDKDRLHYGVYTVDNSISSLDIDATAVVNKPSTYCPNAANVEIFGGEQLQFGQNVISIVVTAPDGETQKVYDIIVYREPIAYEVDEEAIKEDGYTLTVNEDLLDYTIDIGKKKTHEVDFKEYIKLLNDVTDQDVEINYLTNIECDPDDVILELVTEDGISTLVTFHVESTGNSHADSSITEYLPLLIGLLIVIILLTAILISVNRDKYGKITRKADKKADKNQKDASKK